MFQVQLYSWALLKCSWGYHGVTSTLSISTLTQTSISVSRTTLTPCCLGSPERMGQSTVSTVHLWIICPVEMMVLYTLWHSIHTCFRKPAGLNVYLWLWNRMKLMLLNPDLDLNLHSDRASPLTGDSPHSEGKGEIVIWTVTQREIFSWKRIKFNTS